MTATIIEIHNRTSPRVRVIDVLKNADYSVDMGSRGKSDEEQYTWWREMLAYKVGDTGFQRLVHRLIEQGWDTDSAVGINFGDDDEGYDYGNEGWSITEGHHRLCAAILLGMEEIPYEPWGRDSRERVSAHSGPDPLNALGLEF
jgi:hypothetical protein